MYRIESPYLSCDRGLAGKIKRSDWQASSGYTGRSLGFSAGWDLVDLMLVEFSIR
ncbi:hypothetical protein H6F77_26110 [Microcoleus sp. FACHB-831]|uniref:hypothetical protein n=1 Tax=Microcoleus sp. FACHB-831 TaxID=2692827 RepID=UPI001687D0B1|nr:hypothetical protein [Microcoleus sp. FACHB-831]MBD1924515.1 hypothetical protein [Microcoleus sp. FACHB-831]